MSVVPSEQWSVFVLAARTVASSAALMAEHWVHQPAGQTAASKAELTVAYSGVNLAGQKVDQTELTMVDSTASILVAKKDVQMVESSVASMVGWKAVMTGATLAGELAVTTVSPTAGRWAA